MISYNIHRFPPSFKSTFFFFFFFITTTIGYSQCTYTLELFDSFGDGWNGAMVTVTTNGTSTGYTIDDGEEQIFTFEGISNEAVSITYTPGTFENEVSYNLLDPSGDIIFTDGPFPQQGEVLYFFACPTCPGPLVVNIDDIGGAEVDLSWAATDSSGTYVIEYGPVDFVQGTGVTIMTNETSITISGLVENTAYEFYISVDCDNGDFSGTLGPIPFQTIWLSDLGVIDVQGPVDLCEYGTETVTVTLQNFGSNPQSLIVFRYAVNGVDAGVFQPLDGLYTGVLSNDSIVTLTFDTEFDFSEYGTYEILAWTELSDDADILNDTASFTVINKAPTVLPMMVDFEDFNLPEDWTSSGFIDEAHNTGSVAIYENIYSGNQEFDLTTARIGPINPGDSLTFDYRYTEWSAGTEATVLSENDMLQIQISTDCGETFTTVETVDMSNHVPSDTMTNRLVDLDAYAGELINIRFLVTWGAGDYWFDLDNINIIGCPIDLSLSADVIDETEPGLADGMANISLDGGQGPYTYIWSNGDTTAMASDLAGGVYMVTVADANGCQDIISFDVGGLVDIKDLGAQITEVLLAPNPTNGYTELSIELNQTADVRVQVMDVMGHLIFVSPKEQISSKKYQLDLSQQTAGLYFVQLFADDQAQVIKLIKTQ